MRYKPKQEVVGNLNHMLTCMGNEWIYKIKEGK